MASLFSNLDLNHKPNRNGFNLSHDVKFTAKAGELLPLVHFNLMPGSTGRISVDHKTRTAPAQSAAYAVVREYFDFFFVPYRILWKQAPQILVQNVKNPVIAKSLTSNREISTQLPQIAGTELFRSPREAGANGTGTNKGDGIMQKLSDRYNFFNFNRMRLSFKLLNHLGYCSVTESQINNYVQGGLTDHVQIWRPNLSLFPLLSYQAIYYYFFRNTVWEDNQPYNYNVDYLDQTGLISFDGVSDSHFDSPTMFDLRYSNYPKDLFFGILPNSQYGEEATVEGFAPMSARNAISGHEFRLGYGENAGKLVSSTNAPLAGVSSSPNYDLGVDLSQGLSVLKMRQANFLQRYREIVGSGSVDYVNLVQKVFGVDVGFVNSDSPRYLGGTSSDIVFSEVVNTNLIGEENATIKGKGYGNGSKNSFSFDAKDDFGLVMCIYHCQPVLDYMLSGLDFDVTKTEVDDYANPVFDRLGFQSLPLYYLVNNKLAVSNFPTTVPTLGYTTRYFDYKTRVNRVLGAFKESLRSWVAVVDDDYVSSFLVPVSEGSSSYKLDINYNFFKVDPRILDEVFGVYASSSTSTDQFYVNASFDIQVVHNLDFKGVNF